jgi:hypothetical protein
VNTTTSPGSTSRTVEHAEHQRAHAPRIAHADQLLGGQRHQRISAFDLLQGVDQLFDHRAFVAAGRQMDDDLGIGGRLEDGAFLHQLGAQRIGVGEIAVMGDGDAAARQVREQGLNVAHRRAARRGIAVVADGVIALQVGGVIALLAEDVADQARMTLGDELAVIVGDDTGRLLTAVLQRMQTENGQRAGAGVPENAKNAALLMQRIGLVNGEWPGQPAHGLPLLSLSVVSMSLSSA